jgi:hypothetical protein
MYHRRHLALSGLFCLFYTIVTAQPNIPAHYLRLMLAQTKLESPEIPANLAARTDRQLLGLLAQDGSRDEDRFSAFVVSPMVVLTEKTVAEAPEVRHDVQLTMHLILTQVFTGQVLEKRSVVLPGTGSTLPEAIVRAMAGVRNNNAALMQSLEHFRTFAAAQLEKECGGLRKTAQDSAGRDNYRAAVAMLHAIPPGTVCFTTVQDAKNRYFQNLVDANCSALLDEARQAYAGNDPAGALRLLTFIAADSPCFAETKAFAEKLEKSALDEAVRQPYNWLLAYFRNDEGGSRAQWNAMNAWALDFVRREGRVSLVRGEK